MKYDNSTDPFGHIANHETTIHLQEVTNEIAMTLEKEVFGITTFPRLDRGIWLALWGIHLVVLMNDIYCIFIALTLSIFIYE